MYKITAIYLFFIFSISACGSSDTDINSAAISSDVILPGHTQPINSQQGLKAFIDPVTGELTSSPSANQINQLEVASQAQLQGQEPLVQQVMPDGSVMIELKDRFHTQLMATVDDNGELRLQHKPVSHARNKIESPPILKK